jgi:hypothetical protein
MPGIIQTHSLLEYGNVYPPGGRYYVTGKGGFIKRKSHDILSLLLPPSAVLVFLFLNFSPFPSVSLTQKVDDRNLSSRSNFPVASAVYILKRRHSLSTFVDKCWTKSKRHIDDQLICLLVDNAGDDPPLQTPTSLWRNDEELWAD